MAVFVDSGKGANQKSGTFSDLKGIGIYKDQNTRGSTVSRIIKLITMKVN